MEQLNKLITYIKLFSKDDIINNIKTNDIQYIVLNQWFKNNKLSKEEFYFLIIECCIITYQLSWTGEKRWIEFIDFLNKNSNYENKKWRNNCLYTCKYNSRFREVKLNRINKINEFKADFIKNFEYYLLNLDILLNKLSFYLNQKNNSKTLTFTIKIIWYLELINGKELKYPKNIMIPYDSRLKNIHKKINPDYKIEEFYTLISEKTNIEQLLLDSILWTNYEKILSL